MSGGDLFREHPTSGAVLSDCRRFRYRLFRRWGTGARRVLWVMLNPSTADHETNDQTIRKCVTYSKDWGFAALEVVNLYALRSTDPSVLSIDGDAIGSENDEQIRKVLGHEDVKLVVCAWGTKSPRADRAPAVLQLIEAAGHVPMCLHITKDGHPGHPLYLRSTLRPVPLDKA